MEENIKQLLLKDLCARLPYDVKCKIEIWEGYDICTVYNINSMGYIEIVEDYDTNGVNIERIKPYLFPLSSMTEEQMEELEELCTMYTPDDDYHPYAHMGIKVLYKHVLDDGYTFSLDFNTDVIDWLNKNHFDYRGLIEEGLAIDATGKNIY